jgi:hypothetical protein
VLKVRILQMIQRYFLTLYGSFLARWHFVVPLQEHIPLRNNSAKRIRLPEMT